MILEVFRKGSKEAATPSAARLCGMSPLGETRSGGVPPAAAMRVLSPFWSSLMMYSILAPGCLASYSRTISAPRSALKSKRGMPQIWTVPLISGWVVVAAPDPVAHPTEAPAAPARAAPRSRRRRLRLRAVSIMAAEYHQMTTTVVPAGQAVRSDASGGGQWRTWVAVEAP